MMRTYLDFEKSIAELEGKIDDLQNLDDATRANVGEEISRLQSKATQMLEETYSGLNRWQKSQVARHAGRPHFSDYVSLMVEDFTPLAGDRQFGEDKAIMGGPARFRGRSIMLIGHEKGADTKSRIEHNFGSANPEGYRKAIRLMDMADRFGLPVVALVDTQGAYPGRGAEERGQAEAIATCTQKCLTIGVPMISAIVGEGGSGGAVALATANRVLMLEHSVYAVISPEGCASILWNNTEDKGASKAPDAAEAMKISAQDLKELGVIDTIIEEPLGGAHRDVPHTVERLADAIEAAIHEFDDMDPAEVRKQRHEKFLAMGRQGLAS